ncbi:hypothetical protein TRVL_04569 [Trypanosoma vivax]|nr:hypothetical protein TRVL_04569 [Trypanosoma vivax]
MFAASCGDESTTGSGCMYDGTAHVGGSVSTLPPPQDEKRKEEERKEMEMEMEMEMRIRGALPVKRQWLSCRRRCVSRTESDSQPQVSLSDLLESQMTHQRETDSAYEEYAAAMAKMFKQPPAPLPEHLVNNFSGPNVLAVEKHGGYKESVQLATPMFMDRRSSDMDTHRILTPAHSRCSHETDLVQSSEIGGNNPRFTVHSLPNGDVVELDAHSGGPFRDAEPPLFIPTVGPSRLLEERMEKMFHNYRFYSNHFRAMVVEFANAIGGQEGAEILRRYEEREWAEPLTPMCMRSFYESVVDYNALLLDQERMMEEEEARVSEFLKRNKK